MRRRHATGDTLTPEGTWLTGRDGCVGRRDTPLPDSEDACREGGAGVMKTAMKGGTEGK
jgi:hypothetical protein